MDLDLDDRFWETHEPEYWAPAFTWFIQGMCIGLVLGKDSGPEKPSSFETLEIRLGQLNDEAANLRWANLKATVPLSDDFIRFVKAYMQRTLREDNIPVSKEHCTTILKVYGRLRDLYNNM